MRKNVLVIDDDPHIQELVSFFLEQAGFVVRVAKDGYSALDELSNNSYDLLILDISMPHMNGFNALRRIRADEKLKDLPVLMLTGSTDKNDVVKANQLGITDYIIKPPKRGDLLSRVERVLGGKPQFKAIEFNKNDPAAEGSFTHAVKVISLSANGLILEGDVCFPKDHVFENLEVQLFKDLELDNTKFKITDCTPTEDGNFHYFVSFLGLNKKDQERIQEWVTTKSFEFKNKPKKAS